MKAIIYKTETGCKRIGIALDFINTKSAELKAVKTNAEKSPEELVIMAIGFLALQVVPDGAEWKIFDTDDEPVDKLYDDSWDYDLKEDIVKLREIKKGFLRADREKLFTMNDRLLRDALLENDPVKKATGMTECDRLRDITKLVDVATTIDAIKAIVV